jgi:hypothetical protein
VAVCPKCRADVYAGYASGIFTLYDQFHLTQKGEAEALIRKMRTYLANHPHFDRRTAWTITRDPAPKIGFVVRTHRCTAPPPMEGAVQDPQQQAKLPDECPF